MSTEKTETPNYLSEKAGMSPGSLLHIGDIHEQQPRISVTDYNKKSTEKLNAESIDDILHFKDKDSVTWVNIEGLKNIELIQAIGDAFNIHPLVLEDILNTHQRPKFEDYDDYQYIVLKGLSLKSDDSTVNYEQISILLLKNFVFTFREKQNDLFVAIEKRIQNDKSRFRSTGSDYLAYAILDCIVDQNFTLIESLDEIIDSIEEELLINPETKTLTRIQGIKRELIYIRRATSPLRELLTAILRNENPLLEEKTQVYFRDVYDHVLRISETIELQRDMVYSLMEMYQSSISNKMNEVMKVLTVFASIFIPLTFIAGVYGMNFEFMPELKWRFAYPVLWVVFIIVAAGLLVYFRKKKWL
jgi:magnesium transporter